MRMFFNFKYINLFFRKNKFMINIIFGIIAGIGTAIGIGGGTILILLLNFFTKMEQYSVQGINLIFFIPTSLLAIYMDLKNKLIHFKIVKKLIITGAIGAICGAVLASKVENSNLRKYFGIFLIIIALNGTVTFILQYIKSKKDKNINYKK